MKHRIIAMCLNARGVCDTARGLRISTDTVLSELKKKEQVNQLIQAMATFSASHGGIS